MIRILIFDVSLSCLFIIEIVSSLELINWSSFTAHSSLGCKTYRNLGQFVFMVTMTEI